MKPLDSIGAMSNYIPSDCPNRRPLVAEFKLGRKRIGVQTDGGLQILLPQAGNSVEWDRSYYEIALEVSFLCPFPLFTPLPLFTQPLPPSPFSHPNAPPPNPGPRPPCKLSLTLGKTLFQNSTQQRRRRRYLRIRSRAFYPRGSNFRRNVRRSVSSRIL